MRSDPKDAIAFVNVVRCGSFAAAAKSMGIAAPALSRRVARLEEELESRLLHRTTRSLGLTDAGRAYYERVARISEQLEAAERAVFSSRDEPAGTFRVTAPPDDAGVIWAMVSGFVKKHPNVEFELIHSLERLNLIEASIDVALRGGAPPDSSDIVARKVVDSRFVLVASPSYLEQRGVPTHPRELSHHDCIAMDNWVPNAIKALQGPEGPVSVDFRNRVRCNGQETARRAAMDGLGIAPMVEMTCWPDLEAGRLVEVLPGALPMPAPMYALYPSGSGSRPTTRAFLEHLSEVIPGLTPRG